MPFPDDWDHWARHFPRVVGEYWRDFLEAIVNPDEINVGTPPDIVNISEDGVFLEGEATMWDDLKFPLEAVRLDSASTRYSFDSANCAIQFDSNARYPNEIICFNAQMPHAWLEGSGVRPHLHWLQQQDNDPNWLLRWRIIGNGEAPTSWTLTNPSTQRVFTYVSGTMLQITQWPEIDMTGYGLSDIIQMQFYRDSTNASGEFAGADPYTIAALAVEVDIHIEIDAFGSDDEYVKGPV